MVHLFHNLVGRHGHLYRVLEEHDMALVGIDVDLGSRCSVVRIGGHTGGISMVE